MDHRIVVTGASGTLGRNFLELVRSRKDIRVLALLRPESKQPPAFPSLELARIDRFDSPLVGAIVGRFNPTCLIHCAATGMNFPKAQWFELIKFNVDVSLNLCQCAATIPGCHFIFVSTGIAYRETGFPLREDDALDTLHPYGASKAAADLLVRSASAEFGARLTVLRPFSFTGLGDDRSRLFGSLLRSASQGIPVDLSPGNQIRDHCSARDVAAAMLAAVEAECPEAATQKIYNVGSGRLLPLRALIEEVVDQLGLNIRLNFGARQFAPFEPMHLAADYSRASAELGWHPRHNLAHAVWELARESFPQLPIREPSSFYDSI